MSRLERVVFLFGSFFYAYAYFSICRGICRIRGDGYLSCECATLNFHVKPALFYFAGLCSFGGAADAFGDGDGDIWLSIKTEGARRLVYTTTAKSLGGSSRSS